MLRSAREADKEYVHLGLGVNDGIRRFKTKWGGLPGPALRHGELAGNAPRDGQ